MNFSIFPVATRSAGELPPVGSNLLQLSGRWPYGDEHADSSRWGVDAGALRENSTPHKQKRYATDDLGATPDAGEVDLPLPARDELAQPADLGWLTG